MPDEIAMTSPCYVLGLDLGPFFARKRGLLHETTADG